MASSRRTRIRKSCSPQLRKWLHRVTRAHAALCYVVRVYGDPKKAGVLNSANDIHVERAAKGDPTLLHDALGLAIEELESIKSEVCKEMDDSLSTKSQPGSLQKIETMRKRASEGKSIFIDGDSTLET